jgi:hypothetical protein
MKSVSLLSLLVVVLAQLWVSVSAMDPLLAEAHGLGLDLKEHIATLAKEEHMLESASLTLGAPTFAPTVEPTIAPTIAPSVAPTVEPSAEPTAEPTYMPTTPPNAISTVPSAVPTYVPTFIPTAQPSAAPTVQTTTAPAPSVAPTVQTTTAPAPSVAPTVSPTRAPTALPTAAPSFGSTPVITFSSAIGLAGLSSPSLNTNSKNSISQATCATMNLPTSSCSFWGSSATQTARRMLRDVDTEAVYTVTAYVNTTVSVPSGTSSDSYYSTLTTSLSNTTALAANLQTAAVDNGATSTLGAVTVTGVTSTPPTVTNPPSSSSSKKNLSGGAIAGIVIGCVVGFSLIAFAVYYFCFRESGSYQATGDSNFNARHHRKSNELPISL